MLDSPMLVDQNMVCRSNTDQRDHFPRIHLDLPMYWGRSFTRQLYVNYCQMNFSNQESLC